MNTAEANCAWVRDLLWRKDPQFAEKLDHVLRTEVVALCALCSAAAVGESFPSRTVTRSENHACREISPRLTVSVVYVVAMFMAIVDMIIHLEAYAGAARAFHSYRIAL
jgi:hypothetical protein